MAMSEKDIGRAPADVCVYTDGLCVDGFTGTGLAVFRRGDLSELWYGLHGSDSTSKLAELRALQHALWAAKDEIREGHSVAIFSDSDYAVWIVTDRQASKKLPRATPRSHAAIIQPAQQLYVELREQLTIHHAKGSAFGNKLAKVAANWAIDAQEQDLKRYRGPMEVEEIFAYTPE